MYTTRRRSLFVLSAFLCVLFFVMLANFLIPTQEATFSFSFLVAMVAFCILLASSTFIDRLMGDKLKENVLYTKETEILSAFISKIRFAYSLDDLFTAVRQELEDRGDCSVLFIDRQSQYVIYNSPDRLVSDVQTMQTLERNFPARHMDGIYFIDAEFGIVSNQNAARGFFIAYQKKHFYVFCRYTRLFDPIIFNQLYDEFVSFTSRSEIITELTRISELSKEWNMVAETQRSFLPKVMPEIKHLDIAAYFRPLVNVSGDYYTVIPIN